MVNIFIGNETKVRDFLKGIVEKDIINSGTYSVNKIFIIYKGEPTIADEMKEIVKTVEVEKIVKVDNPAHLEKIKVLEAELAQCQESCVEKDARLKNLGTEIQKLKNAVAAYTAE